MAGTLLPAFVQQFEDLNGKPLAGSRVYSWLAGTTTPTALFQDAALTAPHPWPAVADGAGRLTAFLPQTSIRLELRDANDVVVVPAVDNIQSVPSGDVNVDISGVAGENLAERQVVYLSDGSEGPPEVAGEWYLADADEVAKSTGATLIGVVVAPVISQGNTGQIRLQGTVDGFAGLTPGLTYYISATAGGLTSSPPPNARVVGIAQSDTTLLLTPASSSSSDLGVFTQLQVTGAGLDALVLAGGMQTGPGASVQLLGTDGRIPAIDSTRFASLSGANLTGIPETAITDGTLLARLAANEVITGQYAFTNTTLPARFLAPASSAIALRVAGRASDNVGVIQFTNAAEAVQVATIASGNSGLALAGPGTGAGTVILATTAGTRLTVADTVVTTPVPIQATADAGSEVLRLRGRAADNVGQISLQTNAGVTQGAIISTPGNIINRVGGVDYIFSGAQLTVPAALAVTGATTLSSTLAVTSNATVGGTLGVTGTTTMSGSLTMGDGAPILADTGSNGGYMFSGDTDTGMTGNGLGSVDVLSNNVTRISITSGSVALHDNTGAPNATFNGPNISLNTPDVRFPVLVTTGAAANAVLEGGIFNRLLRSTSSRRMKRDITPLSLQQARQVLQLQPVTYRGVHDYDDRFWSGFIAEDVAAIDPTLVTFESDGQPNYVTYDRVPAYLLRVMQDLVSRIEQLESAQR